MDMFGMEMGKADYDNIEFVYVEFEPYVPVVKDGKTWNPNYIGTYKWGAKGIGFGEIAMYRMSDDQMFFDTEGMNTSFVRQMLAYTVEHGIVYTDYEECELPEYYKKYA